MKNKMFSGWKDVFLFTLKQGFTQRYKLITLVLAFILFAAGFGFHIIAALGQSKEENISSIETVYVIDESGIRGLDWEASKQLDREKFPTVTFQTTEASVEDLGRSLNDNEATSVIAELTKEKDSYRIICIEIPSAGYTLGNVKLYNQII